MRKSMLFLVLIIASCTNIEQAPKPEDFYGDEKMTEIMTELYLMESSMTANRATFTDLGTLPSDYIYQKYDTDSVSFKKNLYYYTDRNDEYMKLMERIKGKLELLKDTVEVRVIKEFDKDMPILDKGQDLTR